MARVGWCTGGKRGSAKVRGKIVAATGATSGIGEKAVEALARQGARIVFIARNRTRAEATLARLETAAPRLGHKAYLADLSLMREAKRVGAEIAAAEPRVDVLINNAGAIFGERRLTAEGLEQTFALNHMSYFILTALLTDRLKAAPAGRIVSTASRAHRGARLDFDDLQSVRGYNGWRAYQRSKLANILFTRELAHRLTGGRVTANCLHPGFVASRFADAAGGWTQRVLSLAKTFALSPEQGANTIVYLASSPEVAEVSGEYFAKRRIVATSSAARDMDAARRLWLISEDLMASA
jgi:NAD(P)-dependent dehydrogenase (short-subunit alcohol dehydrogenase family)